MCSFSLQYGHNWFFLWCPNGLKLHSHTIKVHFKRHFMDPYSHLDYNFFVTIHKQDIFALYVFGFPTDSPFQKTSYILDGAGLIPHRGNTPNKVSTGNWCILTLIYLSNLISILLSKPNRKAPENETKQQVKNYFKRYTY